METFDNISCEEYYSVYDEQEDFENWVANMEAEAAMHDSIDNINAELRMLAAK